MTKAVWRHGARVNGVKAEVAHEEFERIRRGGPLTAKSVVDASRPSSAPLHPAFTWNNKEAGELYRLIEARTMIRSVMVVRADDGEPERQYVHVSESAEQGAGRYETVAAVVASVDLYANALAELTGKVNDALESVRELERAAQGSSDSERLMRVGIAVKAMETAAEAIRMLQ